MLQNELLTPKEMYQADRLAIEGGISGQDIHDVALVNHQAVVFQADIFGYDRDEPFRRDDEVDGFHDFALFFRNV